MYSLLHGQESIRINENLDNATILKANEDVGLLKKEKYIRYIDTNFLIQIDF